MYSSTDFSTSLSILGISSHFNSSYPDGCEKVSHFDPDLHFSVECFLIFLIVFSEHPKFLILMRSNVSTFSSQSVPFVLNL